MSCGWGRSSATGRQAANSRGQRLDTREMGIDQLPGLLARERLDADRGRHREQSQIKPVGPHDVGPLARRLALDVEDPGLLAGAVQDHSAVGAAGERQAAPSGQRV